jgi:SNF2 family DNA or RNA helicase
LTDNAFDKLYPHQRAGVRFLRVAGSALLADEMGTGKTVQVIATLESEDLYPALIVCPNSVKSVWESEFERWAPLRHVVTAGAGTAAAEEAATDVANGAADVLIINWEALKNVSRLAPFGSIRLESCSNCDPTSRKKPSQCQREDKILNLIRWAAVVADEAHRAKDPKSQQTRALWAVGDRAEHRFALTGTPIANSPEDLWSVMRFVAPDEYPAKWAWIERYAQTVPNVFSGGVEVIGLRSDRREELDRYFLPRFLRRTKAEVLSDLPPKVYVRRDVFLSGKQKKAYDQMEREMIAAVEGGSLVATNGLTAALRLRQLASAYGEVISVTDWAGLSLDDPEQLHDAVDKQVRLSEPSSKLDVLEEVLDELGEQQAVIFAESRQLIELAAARLEARGAQFGLITGAVGAEERATTVARFQEGDLQYILATVAAGGEGITLTAASTAIFLQRPWSAVLNAQAEDRLHRIGQKAASVTYIDLVTKDTIEESVFEALRVKAQRLQDVVRDEVRV